jgi:hypothetical protein
MNKSAQGRLDNIPPEFEWMRPLLTAVCVKYGDRWTVPYVAGRQVLNEIRNESGEIDEQEFWYRLEKRINEPPKKGGIHRDGWSLFGAYKEKLIEEIKKKKM